MPDNNAEIMVIGERLAGLADKIDSGFAAMQHGFEEQAAVSETLAARLLTVELGEAGCRSVRSEFSSTRDDVVRIREELASAKARIGVIVAASSVAISAAVALALKYLGG